MNNFIRQTVLGIAKSCVKGGKKEWGCRGPITLISVVYTYVYTFQNSRTIDFFIKPYTPNDVMGTTPKIEQDLAVTLLKPSAACTRNTDPGSGCTR